MKTFSYKTGLLAGALLTLAISGIIHAQQPANLEPMLRELGIMRNIFAGALEQQTRKNQYFGGGPAPDALYLAGQGMVFTFNLPSADGGFVFDFGEFCGEECGSFDYDFDYDVNVDIDVDALPALPALPAQPALPRGFDASSQDYAEQEKLREFNEATQEKLREFNEAVRAKSEELRDMQREMRDLGREQRNNPDDESLSAQMDALESSADELEAELDQQRESYQQTMEAYQNERIAAFNTRREAQIDQVLGVLCDYGSTLKVLPTDENVSLIFRNFTGGTDQVYVFSHSAVSDCASADSLQQSAISYQL